LKGKKRDILPARGGKEVGEKIAGKNYLDFFWIGRYEVLTLASQKQRSAEKI
jgi:hypothetical protein